MLSKFLPAILAAVMLAACSKPKPLASIEGNEYRSSVVLVTAPDQENYLSDYFPTIQHFDSIVGSEGINIGVVTDSTFLCTTEIPLGTIDLWHEGQQLTLVVEDGAHFKPGYAHLFTSWTMNGKVGIGYTERPTTIVALWQNKRIPDTNIEVVGGEIVVKLPAIPANAPRRTYLRVYAATKESPMSDILVPLDNGQVVTQVSQLDRHDPETQILYSLMIDRFCNGNKANDWSINNPKEVRPEADYQGGDIAGITEKIKAGFFDSLSINTIWISPITQNPTDAWGKNKKPKTKFSAYHGYWPIYITKLDGRFATPDELREMLATAHAHGINVILDYVANHLHINSPLLKAHPNWKTPAVTADGKPNLELWDTERLTTWFDKHIPSLDLECRKVADILTDSALYWVRNYDFDGYRHDACKHIPLNYWRTFGQKLANDPTLKDRHLWMIGETYGSPDLIGSYVKTGLLNAQFDFNIYHTAIDVFGNHNDRPMSALAQVIEESAAAYGSHNTMGVISGNHDKARFVSLAGGALSWDEDHKLAGWTRHVGVGNEERGFAKSLLLEKLNLTLPGVPCIYQGDEYGQEGANDPDNRRFMRFGDYTSYEQHHLAEVRRFASLRRNNLAFQFGDYLPLFADSTTLVFLRIYMGRGFLVAINNSDMPVDITVNLPEGVQAKGERAVHVGALDVFVEAI